MSVRTALVTAVAAIGLVGHLEAQALHRKCKAEVRGQATACIMEPREGATLKGGVKVALSADEVTITAVAQAKAGGAHYHLFLDVDALTGTEAIPQGPGVTHLGDGQKTYQLDNLTPGMHRLIVVLGDNSHVPVARQRSDTTYFTIAAR